VTNLLLGFHLLGVVCFFVGGVVVGWLQLSAIRQERPSRVYAYLRRAPFGAALVGVGALLTLGFGIGLAEHKGLGLSPAWIQASLGLWLAAMVLGAYGGRTARHARHLARKLAAKGDEPSPELRVLVSARGPLYASYASFVLLLGILVLMVWQPGGSEAARAVVVPTVVQQQILRDSPQLGYVPTRLPSRVTYSRYELGYPNKAFHLTFKRPDGKDALAFSVYRTRCLTPAYRPTSGLETLTVNGYRVGWDGHTKQAWRCVTQGNSTLYLEADALTEPGGPDRADLVNVVAYAAPFS